MKKGIKEKSIQLCSVRPFMRSWVSFSCLVSRNAWAAYLAYWPSK